jgi:hypothetical protein
VTATLILSESGTIPGRTKVDDKTFTKVYSNNATETVKFYDIAGNSNTITVAVTRIYRSG